MKRISNYLKMRVLGALEHAPGDTLNARYQAVSKMTFQDEDGHPRHFTWRTIQTWWYHYREHGVTDPPARADKGSLRKLAPEDILAAIEKALPSLRTGGSGKNAKRPLNIQALYRACIEQGQLRRDQIAPSTSSPSLMTPHVSSPTANSSTPTTPRTSSSASKTPSINGASPKPFMPTTHITYSAKLEALTAPDLTTYIHNQLERVGLPHTAFTDAATNLITRSAEGTLRAVKNLCIGSMCRSRPRPHQNHRSPPSQHRPPPAPLAS